MKQVELEELLGKQERSIQRIRKAIETAKVTEASPGNSTLRYDKTSSASTMQMLTMPSSASMKLDLTGVKRA